MNYIKILGFLMSTIVYAQVGIGTGTMSSSSVILEFDDSSFTKAVIVPRVDGVSGSYTPGTILFDYTDGCMKVYDGAWSTCATAGLNTLPTNYPPHEDIVDAKMIIGADTSSADGALILESSDKAMVLPHVASPENMTAMEGMIVYDSINKKVAVFNGTSWVRWE